MMLSKKTISAIRVTSLIILLVFGLLVFVFALLSGSETYGGGISGIIKNSPNALPYAILLVLVYVAWRWPLIGGILITLLGFGLLYLFGFFDTNRDLIPFIVAMVPVIFGGLIIFCWGLQFNQSKNKHLHHGN